MTPEDVLEYWLGPPGDDDPQSRMKLWFSKNDDTDREIRERFGDAVEAAGRGELAAWRATPRGALAEIILLDQFTRNIHRNDGRSWALDDEALDRCLMALEAGHDRGLHLFERLFMYLPLEHAENRALQRKSVRLFTRMVDEVPDEQREMAESFLDYAVKHEVIVERFGRFPHRNALLGRESTPEELAFLETPGSSF